MNESAFKPAWWLSNPHLQTIWPTFFRHFLRDLPIRRERFELPDGDFVDLDWLDQDSGPIVIILHGLEGSIQSPYAKGMLLALHDFGWRGVLMHFRGCSGESNRLPHSYHSGYTVDLATVVQALKKREPDTDIAAIGFSLGGNVLLKWLGETGEANPLIVAVAVSVPFDLHKASERMSRGFSRFYQWHLLKCLSNRLIKKYKFQSAPIDVSILEQVKTMKEFDDKVTAPLHGFANADEYYRLSSCRQYLRAIRIPTLLLQAKDDPFMTADAIPEKHELSPQVELEVTANGGHVGFIAGKFPGCAQYWLEERVPAFLQNYL